jgi:hypothetical protein
MFYLNNHQVPPCLPKSLPLSSSGALSPDPKSLIWDICQVNHCQLALTVGILGVGIMNSTAFLLSSKSNSKINRNQIASRAIDFQPHPPTLAPIFANLDQEVDLTIGSFNFHVGSLGSVHLLDPINSGLSTGKAAVAATSETSVGSSSEINSPVSLDTSKTYLLFGTLLLLFFLQFVCFEYN